MLSLQGDEHYNIVTEGSSVLTLARNSKFMWAELEQTPWGRAGKAARNFKWELEVESRSPALVILESLPTAQ
jgi:hypothetical protein